LLVVVAAEATAQAALADRVVVETAACHLA